MKKSLAILGLMMLLTGCMSFPQIRPVTPPVKYFKTVPTIETLSPQLEWAPFPNNITKEKAKKAGKTITDVKYDLIIFKKSDKRATTFIEALKGEKYEVVLLQESIEEPFFALPFELQPRTKYFWRVRAHYMENGKPKQTKWSYYAEWAFLVVGFFYHEYFFSFWTPDK